MGVGYNVRNFFLKSHDDSFQDWFWLICFVIMLIFNVFLLIFLQVPFEVWTGRARGAAAGVDRRCAASVRRVHAADGDGAC